MRSDKAAWAMLHELCRALQSCALTGSIMILRPLLRCLFRLSVSYRSRQVQAVRYLQDFTLLRPLYAGFFTCG